MDYKPAYSWKASRNRAILPFNTHQERRPTTEPRPHRVKNGAAYALNGAYWATLGWAALLIVLSQTAKKALKRLRDAPVYLRIQQERERALRETLRRMRDEELPAQLAKAKAQLKPGDRELAKTFTKKNAALVTLRIEIKTKSEALNVASKSPQETGTATTPLPTASQTDDQHKVTVPDRATLLEMKQEIEVLQEREAKLSAEVNEALEADHRLKYVRGLEMRMRHVAYIVEDRERGHGYEASRKWHRRRIEGHVIRKENRRERLQRVADEEDRRRQEYYDKHAEYYTSSDEE